MLASHERRIQQFNRNVARSASAPVSRAQRDGRQQDTHVKARLQHEKELARAAASLDRQRAAALSTIYRAEERQRLASERKLATEGKKLDREREAARRQLDRQRSAALAQLARRAERDQARGTARRGAAGRALVGNIGRSVAGTLSGVGSIAVGALGIGGTIAMGSAIRTQMDESARASQLANQAGNPALKGELLKQAQGVRGFTGMEALEGLGSFVDITGDLGSARDLLTDMADVATATSTDLKDLGGAMGTAFIPLADAIKDPTERMKALKSVMKATAGMGAVGAVEVKDLASEMAGLAATSARFSGDAEKNLNMMVAFAQASRQRGGSSSAAEAVTSVQRFGSDLLTGPAQKRLAGLGVDVFSDKSKTQLKGADEILIDVLQKTKGNLVDLNAIFGERGVRAVSGFSPLFTQAEAENAKLPKAQRQKVGEAGATAVRDELDRLMKASVSDEQIKERVASRMADPDMQFKEAMKAFNQAVGQEMLPAITRLIPEFTKLIPAIVDATKHLTKFVQFAVENPFKALGAVVAAKLTAELASAGIGSLLKTAAERLFSGGGSGASAGAAVLGGATGGGGKAGGMVPALAATAALVGVGAAIDQGTQLSNQSGGFEGVLAGIGSFLSGDGFFKGVDTHMNNQARERFEKENFFEVERERRAPTGNFGTRALPEGLGVVNSKGEKVDFNSLSAEQQKALLEAASKLDSTATKLDAAAGKLSQIGPNRGNTPSDGNPTKT